MACRMWSTWLTLTRASRFFMTLWFEASQPEIHVTSATDPSSTSPYRPTLLNAIWVFDGVVDLDKVATGSLSEKALFYVRCGEEPAEDVACGVTLDYTSALGAPPNAASSFLTTSAMTKLPPWARSSNGGAAVKQRWEPLVSRGAQFITGDERLDNLYKTSLINIFLLRTKYPGKANHGAGSLRS